ncbi:hypothetical protein [Acetobacterium tundrae]|nr:hypothetical protein [Acetobacterium tundrae]
MEEIKSVEILFEDLKNKHKNEMDEDSLEIIIDEMIFSLLF